MRSKIISWNIHTLLIFQHQKANLRCSLWPQDFVDYQVSPGQVWTLIPLPNPPNSLWSDQLTAHFLLFIIRFSEELSQEHNLNETKTYIPYQKGPLSIFLVTLRLHPLLSSKTTFMILPSFSNECTSYKRHCSFWNLNYDCRTFLLESFLWKTFKFLKTFFRLISDEDIGNRVKKDEILDFFLEFRTLQDLVKTLNVFNNVSHFFAVIKEQREKIVAEMFLSFKVF